ncbi:hypothetical protein [Hyphomonas sp.]|jgi:hypothetical protein|uniref:hypothetical protein n=1 Tax=Hyphomonas sp. TaxID=87 RepID=UPI0032D8E801
MAEFLVLHQKNNNKVRVVNIEHVRMLRPHDEAGTWLEFGGDSEISSLLVREDLDGLISFLEAEHV